MFKTILLKLEGGETDRTMVEHVKPLAKLAQGRVVLLHVDSPAQADGESVFNQADSAGIEHLRKIHREFQSAGIPVELELAYGDPAAEIVKRVRQKGCDLVALGARKRRRLSELFLGTVASRVQERIEPPVLVFRAEQTERTSALAER
jgi:nucleotide-binding universal stress UspA family protein